MDGTLGTERGAVTTTCKDQTEAYLGSLDVIFNGGGDPATLEALACRGALPLSVDPVL